jgi:hypothetical protein
LISDTLDYLSILVEETRTKTKGKYGFTNTGGTSATLFSTHWVQLGDE